MSRPPGSSVRLRLTLSYAGFLLVAGVLLLAAVGVFLLRYVPDRAMDPRDGFVPNRSDLIRAFTPAAATVLVFLLVFGLVGGWILAGRMLAPLTRISAAASRAAQGSLSHRIRMPGHRDEFTGLADVFDTMLARLEAHVAEQQRFAANASHELRTPLAISQTLLEVARNDPARDTDRLIAHLQSVNTRAIDLTEALLLLSRADQGAFAREPVDLSLVAEEAAETLLPLAERRGVTLCVSGTLARTSGSPALLQQLAANLVHNAIVHNRPDRGMVWIGTAEDPTTATLMVENTGERLSPARVATLTERFQRGTERIRADQAGVGLGLAIVQSITRAHQGTLTVSPRPEGGLRVTVGLSTVGPRGLGAPADRAR